MCGDAPFYNNSEIVLCTSLKALKNEFPCGTYKLLTKVGCYGSGAIESDYAPTTIPRSMRRSLQHLHTQYLDVVLLHDVSPCVVPRAEGNHASVLGAEAVVYGLASEQDVFKYGEGGSTGSTVAARTAAKMNAFSKPPQRYMFFKQAD